MADAGWYPDPQDPASIRYYDGAQWTEHRQPTTQAEPSQSEQPPTEPPAAEQPAGYGAPAEETVARSSLQQPEQQQPETSQPPYGEYGAAAAGSGYAASSASDQPAAPAEQSTEQYSSPYQPTSQYPAADAGPTEQYGTPAAGTYPTAQYETPYQTPAATTQYGGYQSSAPVYGTTPAPPPKKKTNKALLIVGIVVVLVIAGGAVWFFLKPDKPKLTFAGKSIKDSSKVLETAEDNLAAVVKERHGATNDDTRCYYAVPNDEPSGAKSSDVDDKLRCGPVLFVDGDPAAPYLPFSLTSTPSGGSVTLAVSSQPADTDPAPIGDFKLKRPDGKNPPSGSGGLKAPAPPAAEANSVVATDLGPVTPPAAAPETAIIGSYNVGVQLTRAGVVSRYGSGDDARSAPSGSQIVVFQVTPREGDIEDNSDDLFSDLAVVAGGSPIEVPEPEDASSYLAAVVPTGSDPVLQLTDEGIKQTLTLPGGEPGSSNLQVLRRAHRKATNTKIFDTTFQLRQGTGTGSESAHGRYTGAELDYWNPDNPKAYSNSASGALLRVLLNYQDPARPGTDYGFDPAALTLKLPNGQVLPAHNIAEGDFIINVFQVPANFTSGTILISGTYVDSGVTITVSPSIALPVTIPAG